MDEVLERISALARAERGSLAARARAEGVLPEDAVDCVQDGLYTLLTLAREGRLPEAEEAWPAVLATIVVNTARNRRRRHFRARPHDALEPDDHVSEAPHGEALLLQAEAHGQLEACVRELSERERAVVTLRMLEEQSGGDVASALGITPGHVAVLLHRAKQSLRACLAACCDEDAPCTGA